MPGSTLKRGFWGALATLALQAPAYAQMYLDDEPPKTFVEGFVTGVGNPVIGIYHLAAMVGIGILVGIAARGVVPVLAFGAAAMLGVAIQVSPLVIPADSLFVAFTTMVIGILVLRRQYIIPRVASLVFAVAGLVHGYSLGEVLVGAEPVAIIAYVFGLVVVQTAIGIAACAITLGAARWPARRTDFLVVGALMVVVGGFAAIEAVGLIS